MADLATPRRSDLPPAGQLEPAIRQAADRVPAWRLVVGQVGHASRETVRTPVLLVVTLAFPLLFLAVSSLAAGARPGSGGGSAIQRLVPGAAVFAVAMSTFVMLAYSVALAREQGILKRLRGTPLPGWVHLAGRAGAAAWVAVLGTTLMVGVGVLAYGLQVPVRTLPAAMVGLLTTIVTFAILGGGLATLIRGAQTVMGIAMGSVVLLGFVSDLYGFDADLPGWAAAIGWALPLRHGVEVLAIPLDPSSTGAGMAGMSLVALVAWGGLGAQVCTRAFSREAGTGARPSARRFTTRPGSVSFGGNGPIGLVWGQVRHANRSIWREPVFAGFALLMPTLFVVILPQVVGNPEIDGTPFSTSMVTGMMVFGAALTAYVALPELVAVARDHGLLKRLRGTPLPASAYLAGRILSVFWITTITTIIVLIAGWLLYDITPHAAGWLPMLLVLAVGVACLAALGIAVAALVPDADTVPAVSLATLLPLVFLSGIFPLGDALPDIIPTITAWLPLQPMVDAIRAAFTTGALLGRELAILVGWTTAGVVAALARFRWQ